MDLIERAKALDFEMEVEAPPDMIQAIMDGMSIYMEYIKEIPAAEARPVVRGEWLEGNMWQPCSRCHTRGKRSWNFCPHCGADMRGLNG